MGNKLPYQIQQYTFYNTILILVYNIISSNHYHWILIIIIKTTVCLPNLVNMHGNTNIFIMFEP